MKKVAIVTLGCKVNQFESESLAENLEQLGYDVCMELCSADIFVLNSCAVTNEAERKSRNMVSKIKKLNPNAKIYVCGCAVVSNKEQFSSDCTVFLQNNSKDNLVDIIVNDDPDVVACTPKEAERVTDRTRATLCVQTGCNNFCSYCLIPYLRGREKSFPLQEIERQAKKLSKLSNEIVITGINLSAYGKDIEGSEGLIEVARLFKNLPTRFRFSSLEVNVITEDFVKELATMSNFCDHFHLSLQSGSDRTLKFMNRHYTKQQYMQKVNLIRKYFPNAAITTDVIVGFPTETEADFEESLEFAKDVNFASMHIFPYSKRKGTAAEKFKNVATNVDERVKRMSALAEEMKEAYLTANLGKTFEVIIENKKDGMFLAHTKNYILCYIDTKLALHSNEKYMVRLVSIYKNGVLSEIVEK